VDGWDTVEDQHTLKAEYSNHVIYLDWTKIECKISLKNTNKQTPNLLVFWWQNTALHKFLRQKFFGTGRTFLFFQLGMTFCFGREKE